MTTLPPSTVDTDIQHEATLTRLAKLEERMEGLAAVAAQLHETAKKQQLIINELHTTVESYKRQYPLQPPPTYGELCSWNFRNSFRKCRDRSCHHQDEFNDFDKWAKNMTLEDLARHIGFPAR